MRLPRMTAIFIALSGCVFAASAAHAQGAPAPCSCSQAQELTDAFRATRSSAVMLWNCTCGAAQCVVAYTPTSQANTAMTCLSSTARSEDTSKPGEKRGKR
jgi:hypothetical protein